MIDVRRTATLVRKDWRELTRSKQLLAGLVVVPLVFGVVIPAVVILVADRPDIASLSKTVDGMQGLLDRLPAGAVPSGSSMTQTLVYAVLVHFMSPLFLMIPVAVATITASSSIVGEKERRTLEGLLYTPLTDRELTLGKIAVSAIPAVGISWASFVVYAVVVNGLGGPVLDGVLFPTWAWIANMLLLVPLVAFLATCLIVAVSGRSSTMQGAQGASVFVVLPVMGLVVGQAVGLVLVDTAIVLVAAGLLVLVDVVVFALVARNFQRERILTRL